MIWRASIVAAGIALSLCIGEAGLLMAFAQQPAPEQPGAEQPATEQPAAEQPAAERPDGEAPPPTPDRAPAQELTEALDDKEVAQFAAALDLWTKQIKLLEKTVADEQATDEQLREIPSLLETIRSEVIQQKELLRPKLQETRERLAKLGPLPDGTGPEESPETISQRKRLSAEFAAIDGLMKRADVLLVRADQLIDAANAERRERFAESLFRPVPGLFQHVLPAAIKRVPDQARSVFAALIEWFGRAADKGALLILLLLLAPIAGAVAANRFLGRLTASRAKRKAAKAAEPTPQQRGTTAILRALESCLPIWTALFGFYVIATAAEIAVPGVAGAVTKACLAVAWASLLLALVSRSLAPGDASARLVAIDDDAATRIALLLRIVVAVWLVDQFWGIAEQIAFTPYQMTVLRAVVVTAAYAVLLGALLVQMKSGALRQANGWIGWLFSLCAFLAGFMVIAILLGYAELARFVGSHAVSTAGLLWIMYLLHLAAESISSVSVISGRQIDEEEPEEDLGAPSLLTIRIIAGLLMDIVIVVVGVTILLVVWRFDWLEVKGWIQAAFFGFQFGDLRISLQTILIALGVFALGLVLTRFVQRWFTKRAFTRRQKDQGLQESVRVGLGYAGFVLAAVAGLSYLGLDFSNLAIIAGALSVGIGFGLQSIFNNFVSGIILLVERPIKIGDWIAVGGHEGMVKKISVRSTEIETIYRQSVIIPNANLITDTVTNWMHGNKTCRVDIPVGVAYGTDVDLLREVLLKVGTAHPAVLKQPATVVHFAGFGDSSLDFELRVFLRDAAQRITVSSDLRFAIWSALNEAGITIPFPQRDLHIKDAKGLAGLAAEDTPKPAAKGSADKKR